ncbi:hypothetical protein JYU34_011183 [Plutella xylostella]|uniref:Uncharacterized protein n=1 Tax=Plutella xylostella TaxID=51655 RepID=A0ABQ7QHK4_PLUXY|nr:hypothetical protein JYU34_011183 [Plutella xylostella]
MEGSEYYVRCGQRSRSYSAASCPAACAAPRWRLDVSGRGRDGVVGEPAAVPPHRPRRTPPLRLHPHARERER